MMKKKEEKEEKKKKKQAGEAKREEAEGPGRVGIMSGVHVNLAQMSL